MPEPGDPPEDWVGREIDGKYAIEEILGIGGMGMVFRARRPLIGDEVALKVLFPRFLASPLQRRLFEDEAIAAARLTHPNVVAVYDAEIDEESRLAYIAMEYLPGMTFKELLRAKAPMPVEDLFPIAMEICRGLEVAHRAQIIHRDLKPDNVFLESRPDGSRRVKLVDFGIAAMLDADPRDEQKKLLGTLRYMAPEQCRGESFDGRADLYALGVMLYEGLTRRRATGRTVSRVINDVIVPPNEVLEPEQAMDPRAEALVLRLLAKYPEERPATAADLFAEMKAILSSDPEPVAPVRPVAVPANGQAAGAEHDGAEAAVLERPVEQEAPESDVFDVPSAPTRMHEGTARQRTFWIGVAIAGVAGIAGGVAWALL